MDFQALIQDYFDDELTEQQHAELSDWLAQDEANREAFARASMLDAQIRRQLAQSDLHQFLDQVDVHSLQNALAQSPSDSGVFAAAIESPATQTAPKPADKVTLNRAIKVLSHAGAQFAGQALKRHAAPFALAAAVVLAITLFVVFQGDDDPAPGLVGLPEDNTAVKLQTVATLTAQHNAQWAERALASGSALHAGDRLTLTTGFAEITTNDGAVAILEAPTTIELLNSDNALHLHTGKLVGLCHTESSKGFVVKTDHADITDLGTEFGVDVNDNQITTTVFTGAVEITTPGRQPQRITANQTARLSALGDAPTLVLEEQIAVGFASLLSWPAATTVKLPSTGVGLAPGQVDQNWQLVAIDGKALNEPLETKVQTIYPESFRVPGSAAYWIGLDATNTRGGPLRGAINYTFRATFSLPASDGPPSIRMRHAVDDRIKAIRINGRDLSLQDPVDIKQARIATQPISGPFVAGPNTIEIDIINIQVREGSNPVGLIADFELADQQSGPSTVGE